MKQLMAVLIVCTFLSASTAQAFYYEGKCLVPQGKFKKCFLDFSKQDSFKITHKDF
ncbi:MAG: hypothetical protein JNN09_09490, partial [Alphaproteobacteria bacterium]|nr:hypothetical protein [Alphaproteobacteria bacterium]